MPSCVDVRPDSAVEVSCDNSLDLTLRYPVCNPLSVRVLHCQENGALDSGAGRPERVPKSHDGTALNAMMYT